GGVFSVRLGIAELANRVVNHPVHRLAPPAADAVSDFHAPGRPDAGDLEKDGVPVGREAGGRDLERSFAIVVRAVVAGPLDRPDSGTVAGHIDRCLGIKRRGKAQHHAVLAGAQAYGQEHRLPRGADPIEAAGLGLIAGPAEEAAGVELSAAGMEPASHDARRKPGDRQGALASLHLARHGLLRHDEHLSITVREAEQRAGERLPGLGSRKDSHQCESRSRKDSRSAQVTASSRRSPSRSLSLSVSFASSALASAPKRVTRILTMSFRAVSSEATRAALRSQSAMSS